MVEFKIYIYQAFLLKQESMILTKNIFYEILSSMVEVLFQYFGIFGMLKQHNGGGTIL